MELGPVSYTHLLYLSSNGSQTIFLNLTDKKEGHGLEVSLGTIELRDFSDFNPQMWPREMPLPDHYLWQMHTPNDNVGALAIPKSLIDDPQIGTKFILHYFLRRMNPVKVESLEFIPTGLSY